MATNNSANDTDSQRITLLNQWVANAYSSVPTDPQNANDLALHRLALNNGILLGQNFCCSA
jgi:hypothetical protein